MDGHDGHGNLTQNKVMEFHQGGHGTYTAQSCCFHHWQDSDDGCDYGCVSWTVTVTAQTLNLMAAIGGRGEK